MASPAHRFKPMPSFQTRRDTLGTHPLAVLHDAARGRTVRIACRGATVLSIEVAHRGQAVDLADGYRDAAELEARPSSRFAIMAPFANRIADGRYEFDGVPYDLQPGVTGDARGVRHGFVRGADFALAALEADDSHAEALFTTHIAAGDHPGYPFAIDLAIRYRLDARGLALEATMRNAGERAAPCFFGWHPYFRLGDTLLDTWEAPEPSPYFDQKLAVLLREEQSRPPVGWFERMRSRLLFNTGRQFRPALAGALALALLIGGGAFADLSNTHLWHHVPASASATVTDLEVLDNNDQALQTMDQLFQDENSPDDISPSS